MINLISTYPQCSPISAKVLLRLNKYTYSIRDKSDYSHVTYLNYKYFFQYEFTFQYVFDEYTSQKAIFDYVALPLVDDLIKGKNGK